MKAIVEAGYTVKEDSLDTPERFRCTDCPSVRFKTKEELNKHLEDQHSEIYLACKICNFSFKSISNLTKHERLVHGKDMDYKCTFPICRGGWHGRKIGLGNELKMHQKTHINDLQYFCQTGAPTSELAVKRVKEAIQAGIIPPNTSQFTCPIHHRKLMIYHKNHAVSSGKIRRVEKWISNHDFWKEVIFCSSSEPLSRTLERNPQDSNIVAFANAWRFSFNNAMPAGASAYVPI